MSGYEIIDMKGNRYEAPVGVRGINIPVYISVYENTYQLFMFGRMFNLKKIEKCQD